MKYRVIDAPPRSKNREFDGLGNKVVDQYALASLLSDETDLTFGQARKAIPALKRIMIRLMSEGSRVQCCGVTFITVGDRVQANVSVHMKGKE